MWKYLTILAVLTHLTHGVPVQPDAAEDDESHHTEEFTPIRIHGLPGGLHFRRRRSVDPRSSGVDFETPLYNITAFGREMILVMEPDPDLISPLITIAHERPRNGTGGCNIRDSERLPDRNCFYRGHVLGEPDSYVSMSICDSLTGSIGTPEYQYFVEPVDRKFRGDQAHAHTITRRDPRVSYKGPAKKCGTDTSSQILVTVDELKEQVCG